MMSVPVEIKRSPIHGQGVFALARISKGKVVWEFMPGLDRRLTPAQVKFANQHMREFVIERGYQNPRSEWVVCIDEAQFLNFPLAGETANTRLGGQVDGEYLLLAARDIEAGEELTVPPESDNDYTRKMEARG